MVRALVDQDGLGPAGEYPRTIKDFCRAEAGWEPTDDKLKYWRENQVIRSLGDVSHPGGNGRVTLYASGTSRLVLRLHDLLAQKPSLAVATWVLWKEGYAIDERWTRQRMADAARSWDAMVGSVKERAFDGADQAMFSDEFLEAENESQRIYNKRLRLVRKLVGSKRFLTFMFHVVRLAFGHKISSPLLNSAIGHNSGEMADEQDIVIAGLGFERTLVDRVEEMQPPTKADIIGPLDKIAESLSKPLLGSIEGASNTDLLAAAREVEAVRSNNRLFNKSLSWLFGRHAFGRGHAARILDEYDNGDEVLLTALWVAARKAFPSEITLEMELHEQKAAEELYSKSKQAQQAVRQNPSLRKKLLNTIRKGR